MSQNATPPKSATGSQESAISRQTDAERTGCTGEAKSPSAEAKRRLIDCTATFWRGGDES